MKHDNKIAPAKPGLEPKTDQTVLVRIAALKAMSVKDLKAEWEKLFGSAAPNNSRKFKSLSAVARAITGTRWNGYRFFGLRERKREEA